jgi:hypothetical protein
VIHRLFCHRIVKQHTQKYWASLVRGNAEITHDRQRQCASEAERALADYKKTKNSCFLIFGYDLSNILANTLVEFQISMKAQNVPKRQMLERTHYYSHGNINLCTD